MIYRLEREQQLNCSIDAAWSFFSSPNNLGEMTPKDMKFEVLTDLGDAGIFKGMIIDYNIRPLLGISMHWQTKITQVDFQRSFTDFQRIGPYALWNHHHEFIVNDKGVLMKDTVDYELPLGLIGRLMHRMLVKKKLENIFNFRYQFLENRFPNTLEL